MNKILIKNVLLDGCQTDIYIEGDTIKTVGLSLNLSADQILSGEGKAVIPSFVNAHTHSAMTLLRGYADDMKLHDWLTTKIWPIEAKLTEEHIYWGARLAAVEMIKTGTTHFNDMYWHYAGTADAVKDSGLFAHLSSAFLDLGNPEQSKRQIEEQVDLYHNRTEHSPNVTYTVGAHALYTVSEPGLLWARDFAKDHGLLLHMHLSETQTEVDGWVEKTGMRPVEYLDSIAFLGPHLIAVHVNWLSDREISILADYGVGVVHCPVSNMKLSSGVFPYERIQDAKLRIGLGTDGCAANNNLDMVEEMKIAALLQKSFSEDPSLMKAEEVFSIATKGGSSLFDLPAGEIKEGMLANLLLIDLNDTLLVPNHNLISNFVYSAHSGCINTTICRGKILMENRVVSGEDEVRENVRRVVRELF